MPKNEVSIEYRNNVFVITKDEDSIKVIQRGPDEVFYRAAFFNPFASRAVYWSPVLGPYGWATENFGKKYSYPQELIIKIYTTDACFDISYDKELDKFFVINSFVDDSVLSQVRPPVIIGGGVGTGTSFVMKLLRFRGLHAGTDAGVQYLRKYHESAMFGVINEYARWNLSADHKQYEWLTDEGIIGINRNIVLQGQSLRDLFYNDVRMKFTRFWGEHPLNSFWGWKHPQNSITLPIWLNIFPRAKVLMINRPWYERTDIVFDEKKAHQGNESQWFYLKSTPFLRERYMFPGVTDTPLDIFYANFEKIPTDLAYCNAILEWIGMTPFRNQEEFEELLTIIHYEGTEK